MSQVSVHQALELAFQHHQFGRFSDAIQMYRQIIAADPKQRRALQLLGLALCQSGQYGEGIPVLRQAVALQADNAESHYDLALALQRSGQVDEAIVEYQSAVKLKPGLSVAWNNLGNALTTRRQLGAAINAYREAVKLRPDFAEALSNLGYVFRELGQFPAAEAACRQSISVKPDHAEGWNNLGNALREQHQLDDATAAYRRAIAWRADFAEAYSNLGAALAKSGDVPSALAAWCKAVELKPDFASAHSNYLYGLHFAPDVDPQAVFEEHRRWNQQHAEKLTAAAAPFTNDRSPDRRLRIGYVSSDLREHVVGRFLLPLLAAHNHHDFEVFCYSSVTMPDVLTQRLAAHVDVWRDIAPLSDVEVTDLVRRDRIDILVDLAGHTQGHHLLVFARRPAPLQVTYLGYPGTTGLTAIQYRLTDALADPPGQTEAWNSEQLLRLPETNWCFQSLIENVPIGPLPAERTGHITFGSFNNLAKVTTPVLRLWARLLHSVPNSCLLLKTQGFGSAGSRDHIFNSLGAVGIDRSRVELRPWAPDNGQHLLAYGDLDIALDTFPYQGTTTTCEALWMGVPVITLAGPTHVSRVGVSLLTNVGLPELIAQSPDDYVRIAGELAANRPRLKSLRESLRQRLQSSPLMDAPRFARHVEEAYRSIWKRWCAAPA